MKKSIIKNTLVAKRSERMAFKSLIHGNKPAIFQIYSKDKDFSSRSKSHHGSLKSLNDKLSEENATGMNIAMAVNTFSGKARLSSQVTAITALFIDDDSGDRDATYYKSLPCPPHAIIETSPKKFHVYWLVENCDTEYFGRFQKALAACFGTDQSVTDLARVMRMPGSYNWKVDPPYLCHTVKLDKDLVPYKLQTLKQALDLRFDQVLAADKAAHLPKPPPQEQAKTKWGDVNAALKDISNHERYTWLQVGMAINSIDNTDEGYDAWDNWSRSSEKYNAEDQRRTWAGFKPSGGVGRGTIFYMAKNGKNTGVINFDEVTLADLFAHTFSNELRFDSGSRSWYRFNGVVWAKERDAPLQCARRLILDLTAQGSDVPSNSTLARFRSAAGMKTIVNQAELLPELQVKAHQFDAHPHLLALQNGVFDLRSKSFRQARPDDFLCLQASVEYDPAAKAPTWLEFVKSVAPEDKSFRLFLRRAAGYTLWGHAQEQKFFVIIGSGGNGKGVFTRTLKQVLGTYAVTVAPNVLTKAYSGNPNSPSPAIAHLAGARMLLCAESAAKSKFDEAFIKQVAGGDELSARSTYGEMFTFKPLCKLWLTTNHDPDIDRNDEAMWRRLIPLPFNRKFAGDDMDEQLETKLLAEGPGILNWFLMGARDYGEKKLKVPDAVSSTITKVQNNADTVRAWLKAACTRGMDVKTEASLAYTSYRKFVTGIQGTSLSQKAFSNRLAALRGIELKRRSAGNVYVGIRIRD